MLAIVGSLVPVRRPTLALRTALSVRGAVALVVGGGPLEGSLKRLAAELSARDRVVFAGRVAHDRIPLFFRAADLSIHTPKFEGFGLSILESMAAGTPPAATPVGAIPDLVSDRETGVFIPEDPARAGEVIGELLSDRETLREMGERCVSVATSRSWLDVAEALLRAYREGCCSGG
ncbi:MAG: hypothetical protein DRO06_04570 [Thermoproteota archaeon]|nr:MAG: hypothetical protein DRO06_04570 [Candidatus Korarchaeota archaeon]